MRKNIVLVLLLLVISACAPIKKIQLDKPLTLDYFYVDTCGDCKVFKKKSIPKLEAIFGDNLTINEYDLDAPETKEIYDQITDQLLEFDDLLYGQGPFIVVEEYFAVIGFNSNELDALIHDISVCGKNEPYDSSIDIRRFIYR